MLTLLGGKKVFFSNLYSFVTIGYGEESKYEESLETQFGPESLKRQSLPRDSNLILNFLSS